MSNPVNELASRQRPLTATAPVTASLAKNFTINGTLTTTNAPVTPVAGQPVHLEASVDNVNGVRISANKDTSSSGGYSFTGYISENETYYLQAHFDGTTTHATSVSTPITVTVT